MLKAFNFKKITYIVLLLIAFLFPISKAIIPVLITVALFFSFFNNSFSKSIKIVFSRNTAILLVLNYLLIALSLFWSDNIKSGLFDLEVKMTMLLFPIIFLNYGSFNIDNLKQVLHYFINGNIVASFICIGDAAFNTFQNHESYFYYTKFSETLHPSYFAMYLTFAIAGCIYLFKEKFYKKNIYPILIILFFVVIIYLLSSKAGFITFALMFPFFVIKLINRRVVSLIITVIGVVAAITFMYKFNDRVSYFVKEVKMALNNDVVNSYDSSTYDRYRIYEISFNLINDNFIHGVGAGDVKNALVEKYIENKMNHAAELKLNVHNQYLETFIGLGIVGFVLLLLLFLYPVILVFRKGNFLLFSFLLIIAFHFLFESMLNTQSGVIYFAYFYCFLNFVNKNNNDKVLAAPN